LELGRNLAHPLASPAHPPPLFLICAWPSSWPSGRAGLPPCSRTAHEAAQPAQWLPQRGPVDLQGVARLLKHTRPNKGTSDPLSTRPVINPLPTRYRVHPNRFTPFVISLRSSRFGAGLEIWRTRLRVPYILDCFPPINNPFPMRILPQLSHRHLARRRHQSV
jgi:hypothetical protein